jgi:hypothetical protein
MLSLVVTWSPARAWRHRNQFARHSRVWSGKVDLSLQFVSEFQLLLFQVSDGGRRVQGQAF